MSAPISQNRHQLVTTTSSTDWVSTKIVTIAKRFMSDVNVYTLTCFMLGMLLMWWILHSVIA